MLKIGALTSKVYAFKGRPWEIKYLDKTDIADNLCCPLLLDLKGRTVLKASPSFNPSIKLEWISDKSRYIHEANASRNRFACPIFKSSPNRYTIIRSSTYSSKLMKAWSAKADFLSVVANNTLDISILASFKEAARKVGADFVSEDGNYLSKTFNIDYSSTKELIDLEKIENYTFVGVNTRAEASIANLMFRLRFLLGNFRGSITGNPVYPNFKVRNYGSLNKAYEKNLIGQHVENLELYGSSHKLLAYGNSLSSRFDASSWLKLYDQLLGIPSDFIRLTTEVNSIGLDYLECDNWSDISASLLIMPLKNKTFKITQKESTCIFATHLTSGIREADLLLPMSSYLEKETAYLDFRGQHKHTKRVISPLNYACNTSKEILDHEGSRASKTWKRFGFWRGFNLAKDFRSLGTGWRLCGGAKSSRFKLVKSTIKTCLGNMFTQNYVLKTSPTLDQIENLQEKRNFAFF